MDMGRPGGKKILLQMSAQTGPLKDVILQQLLIFAVLAVAALLAGLFLYLPALRKTLVPLSNMGEAAQSIDAGNLDVRFPVDQGQMEIDKLSHSFNGMLERLEISFRGEREAKEQMRRFAADASHELRTPLTSIHGFLEVLLRGAADNKEQLYNALNSMHGESKRINKLVEDLLLLARMDGAPSSGSRNCCSARSLRRCSRSCGCWPAAAGSPVIFHTASAEPMILTKSSRLCSTCFIMPYSIRTVNKGLFIWPCMPGTI